MYENSGSFDVSQETISQADALAGPFHESGKVGHDKAAIVAFHYAQ